MSLAIDNAGQHDRVPTRAPSIRLPPRSDRTRAAAPGRPQKVGRAAAAAPGLPALTGRRRPALRAITGLELLFDLGWRASATALAIVLVAKLGERGGALIASVVMTFPMNAGPGFLFVALEQSPGFVSRGALTSFAGTGAVLAFAAVFVRVARRRSFAIGLAAAVLAWLALALVSVALLRSLPTAAGAIALGAGAVALLGTGRVPALPTTAVRTGWHLVLARGLFAGLVVAGVAETAGRLGPTIAGLAYAFPTTMLASLWMLERYYGRAFTLATMARVPAGIATYAGFCLTLHLAAGPLPALAAWALAVVAAVVIALLRALGGRPARRSQASAAEVPGPPARPPWSRRSAPDR